MDSIFYYPGWTRKCITFTIDDGNIRLDRKFLDITEPAGLRGTFNLCTPLKGLMTADEYRNFYSGYEIANHCRYHAYPFTAERRVSFRDEPFDIKTADRAYGYNAGERGLYRIYTYNWTYLADDDKFMMCVDDCRRELEDIFGKGKIRGFIWPCGEQKNGEVFRRLREYGFQSIRKTGCVEDSTGFDLPADRMRWSYNADYTDLTAVAGKYEQYPDDGKLKFFCFGVHSHDFEKSGRWDVLTDFCEKYGNRPSDFWYASVGEIFDYEDACNSVTVDGGVITNPSGVDLYIIYDGKRFTLRAGSSIRPGC